MSYEEVNRLICKEPLESKYEVGAELGRGKFAIVKRVMDKSSGEKYAAKFLRKRRGGKLCRDDIIVEMDIMRQSMDHHRIIKLREVFESTREMILILELATGGELFRMIAVDPLPEDRARDVVLQLLEGVEHLHSLNIVHLDLKPENILLYRKGQLDIRIADFGLALQITPGEQVKTLVGTAEYVAPEILNYEPLSTAADMWSIGALTYALLAGYSPFQGETHSHTFFNVSMCEYDYEDEVFDSVSQLAKDFMEELLIKKPNDRLTATKCLSHPWIKNATFTRPPQFQAIREGLESLKGKEGLDSSTSSLDSALCLDSNISSLEPSPSSSASSSFAPRPSGRAEEDEQEDIKKQLTEKVSKLCTDMLKAENDAVTLNRDQLDGSASSISSIDSNTTLKIEEEEDKVAIKTDQRSSKSISPPAEHRSTSTPPVYSSSVLLSSPDKSHPSASSNPDEEGRSISRPGSGVRITDDVISLAPDTIEKMKKLERLKQKRQNETGSISTHESLKRKFSAEVTNNDNSSRINERKGSVPVTQLSIDLAKKAIESPPIGSGGKVPLAVCVHSVKTEVKSKSPSPRGTSPLPIDPLKEDSMATTGSSGGTAPPPPVDRPLQKQEKLSSTPFIAEKEKTSSTITTSITTATTTVATTTSTTANTTVATTTSTTANTTTSTTATVAATTSTTAHSIPVEKPLQKQLPSSSNTTLAPAEKENKLKKSVQKTAATRSVSTPPAATTDRCLPQGRKEKSASPHIEKSKVAETTQKNSSIKLTLPLNNLDKSSVATIRAKSSSPLTSSGCTKTLPSRYAKSASPNEKGEVVLRRNNRASSTNSSRTASWRKTPHIDPDVIEAILRGDIDDDESMNSKLETMIEVNEPPQDVPIKEDKVMTNIREPKQDDILLGHSILKRGGNSDSRLERVTKSESPRRVMILSSNADRSGTIDLSASFSSSSSSPLKSPGAYSQSSEGSPSKSSLSSFRQSSLTLSHSTPDLSTILGSKHSKRNSTKEDSYVTGNTPRKNSAGRSGTLRSNVLSGANIVRSLTMSGRNAKRNTSHSKFKLY